MCLRSLSIFFSLIIAGTLGEDVTECSAYVSYKLRLKCELLKEYDNEERPVKNFNDMLHLDFILYPISFDMDDYTEKLSLNSMLTLNWTDIYLTWNPEEYGGLTHLRIDCADIWTPDIISLSMLAENPHQSDEQTNCNLYSDGRVRMSFTEEYKTYCVADRTYWPFDSHTCSLYLGSRYFSGPSLDYNLKEVSQASIKKDKVWEITDLKPTVQIYFTGSNLNQTYAKLLFQFEFKRHAAVVSICYVYPGIGMALLLLAVLWLDVASPERLYMLALIIFNNTLFLSYFIYMVPATGVTAPLLICFFRDSIVISGICIINTVINRLLISASYKTVYLTALVKLIVNNAYLKTYLLIDIDPEDSETKETEEEIQSFSLVNQTRKEWKIFVVFTDRMLFILFFTMYLILFLKFYPVI